MAIETSIYLDLVRFTAALVVCLGHLSGKRLTGGLLWQVGPFMAEAVVVFFVLSGFVIGHVTRTRERSPRDYCVARAARIYSVALPALLLTFMLDSVGRALHPELYSANWGYVADGRAWQFLSGAVFANELWFLHVPQGSMLPYWSLGFEVWYYVIFGLSVFARGRQRMVLVIAASAIAGPRILMLLPLWLLGSLCARIVWRSPPGAALGWALFGGSLAGWIGYEVWAARHGRLLNWAPPLFGRPELAQDYLIGALFAANLVGFTIVAPAFAPLLRPILRPARWLAGATFSLYLMHVPIAQFLTTLVPWGPRTWPGRIAVLGGTMVLVFAFAQVTERRKAAWRAAILTLLPGRPSPA